MSSSDQAALSKFGYAKMKEIDSYHPTVGAVNCDDMARFSDADGGQILIDYNMQVRSIISTCCREEKEDNFSLIDQSRRITARTCRRHTSVTAFRARTLATRSSRSTRWSSSP